MALHATITTKSGRPIHRSLSRRVKRIRKDIRKEGVSIAHEILMASRPLVPILTGTLQTSGFVRVRELGGKGKRVKIQIGYGDDVLNPLTHDPSKKYALQQHENLTYAHRNGGQAKYLTQPFERFKPSIVARIAKAGSR